MNHADFGADLEEAITGVLQKHIGQDFRIDDWKVTYGDFGNVTLDLSGRSRYNTSLTPKYSPQPTNIYGNPIKDHTNHEIVENVAGGNTFKYCRTCKEEV